MVENNNVVMYYKNTPLDQNWIGYSTTYGFQLLHSYPNRNSHRETQLPIPIPSEELKDMPSMLKFMGANDKIWWENFMEDQTIIHPSQNEVDVITNEFWNFESQPFQLPPDILHENEPPPLIEIGQHPIIPPQLSKGQLVVVLAPGDIWTFWIGEIFNITENQNKPTYHIHYYEQQNGIWSKMSKRAIGATGDANIESILLVGFSFTKKKKMRKHVLIKIKKKIDKLKNVNENSSESVSKRPPSKIKIS
jgi:hypothetical protein